MRVFLEEKKEEQIHDCEETEVTPTVVDQGGVRTLTLYRRCY